MLKTPKFWGKRTVVPLSNQGVSLTDSTKVTNRQNGFYDEKLQDIDTQREIVPLTDFDWKTTEPLKIRSFKPVYHLTMGMSSLSNNAVKFQAPLIGHGIEHSGN